MFTRMKVALVAKPWRGGLADYMLAALQDVVGTQNVTYLPTRPLALADRLRSRLDARYWPQRLVRHLQGTAYDAVIFMQPTALCAELSPSRKHAVWLFDDARVAPEITAAMGHVFHSDPGYAEEVQQQVTPQQYAGVLPFAMLPACHVPGPVAEARGMCFIANRDSKRDAWLAQIFGDAIACDVYGNYRYAHPLVRQYPKQFHRPIGLGAMQRVYARYQLSLNIHAAVVRSGTNMRSFEAAGYGIAQLVEHRPGIEALFDPQTEISCFQNFDELKAQHERLLRDPALRAVMAERARARVLHEHTYQHRVRTLLQRIAQS